MHKRVTVVFHLICVVWDLVDCFTSLSSQSMATIPAIYYSLNFHISYWHHLYSQAEWVLHSPPPMAIDWTLPLRLP